MNCGIIVFDRRAEEWCIWVDQERYWLQEGHPFELRIAERYYSAWLEDASECFVILNGDVTFILYKEEVYKIRIEVTPYLPSYVPF